MTKNEETNKLFKPTEQEFEDLFNDIEPLYDENGKVINVELLWKNKK